MKILIDRCHECGAPIYWTDETNKREKTCKCDERNPNCCSDGACDGMCFCEEEEKEV
jgi:hypothetical protein